MRTRLYLIPALFIILQSCGPSKEDLIAEARISMQNGNLENAIAILDKALIVDPEDPIAYNMRGIAKLELGQMDEAISDFDKSVDLDDSDYRCFYNRGNAFYRNMDFEKAIADFDVALKLQPKEADIYINRGNALVELEKYDDAIYDYGFSVQLDPNNYLTHFNLARAYYLIDSLDLAKKSFEHCVQTYATFAPAFYYMGMISLEKDEIEPACLYFQKAAELGYQQATEVQKIYCD